jgi:peptide/nickel transport system substrate-binding protein
VRTVAAVAVALVIAAGVTASAGSGATKPTLTIADGFAGYACGNISERDGSIWAAEMPLAYEPLVRQNADRALLPGLATSWTVAPGNKVVTLTLRHNARFSDGTPVTAQAIKTWMDFLDAHPSFYNPLGPVRSIDVLSKWVFRIRLASPNPDPVRNGLSHYDDWTYPVSPRAMAVLKANPKSTILNDNTFGAGPYVYVPSQSLNGDHCVFVPNKYYYDQSKIYWGKIVTRPLLDPNTELAALRAGQVDIVQRGASAIAAPAQRDGFKVAPVTGYMVNLMFIDLGGKVVPALADARVRQAIAYGFNRTNILRLLGPRAFTTSNPANPGMEGLDPKFEHYYSYDPAKAKALLAAAGYPHGFTFKILAVGPWAGALENDKEFESMARDLSAIGITMQVVVPSDSEYGNEYTSGTYGAVAGTIYPLPTFLWYPLEAPTKVDQHGFRDRVIDKLWLQGERASPKAAAKIWHAVVTREITQAYQIAMYQDPLYAYIGKRVGGNLRFKEYLNGRVDPTDIRPTGK